MDIPIPQPNDKPYGKPPSSNWIIKRNTTTFQQAIKDAEDLMEYYQYRRSLHGEYLDAFSFTPFTASFLTAFAFEEVDKMEIFLSASMSKICLTLFKVNEKKLKKIWETDIKVIKKKQIVFEWLHKNDLVFRQIGDKWRVVKCHSLVFL